MHITLNDPNERHPIAIPLDKLTRRVRGWPPVYLNLAESETAPELVVRWADGAHAVVCCSNPAQGHRLHAKYRALAPEGAVVLVNGQHAMTTLEMVHKLRKALRRSNNLLMDIYNTSPRSSIAFQRFPAVNTDNLSLLADTETKI